MKPWVLVLLIFCVGLFLRFGEAWTGSDANMPDSDGYAQIAKSLASQGDFDLERPDRWDQPASNYSPGLPLLLGGFFWIFGSDSDQLARLFLALLGALAIPVVYLLGRDLHGNLAGITGAAIVAFYPTLVADAGLFLTEGLAGLLLAGSLLLAFRGHWLGAGAVIGAGVLVRPEFLLLAAVLLLIFCLQEKSWRPALFGAALLVVLAPWSIYITSQTGHFVPVSTGGGQVLFTGSYLQSDGNPQNLRPALLRERPELLREPVVRNNPPPRGEEVPVDQLLLALALRERPRANPSATLAALGRQQYFSAEIEELGLLMAQKFQQTWLRGRATLTSPLPGKILHLALVAFALLGLFALQREGRRQWIVFLAVLLLTTIGALALVASPRRVLAIWPLVATLGGVGITFLVAWGQDLLPRAKDHQPAKIY